MPTEVNEVALAAVRKIRDIIRLGALPPSDYVVTSEDDRGENERVAMELFLEGSADVAAVSVVVVIEATMIENDHGEMDEL
jgi:hypothetical protein